MFGKLSKEEMEDLLSRQLVGRIGCYAEGTVYVVPVTYAYDKGNIYVHSFNGMKVDMMKKNPRVCFEVEDTRDLDNWKSVIAWGTFEEINDENTRAEAIRKLSGREFPILTSQMMHLSPQWPFSAETEEVKGIFFRIQLTELTGRFEKSDEGQFFAS